MGLVKTTDGNDLDFGTYKQVSIEARKGLISNQDVVDTLDAIGEHKRMVQVSIDAMRKSAIRWQTTDEEACSTWRQYEKDLAISMFNKTEECINREEHIEIMVILLHDVEEHIKGIPITEMSGSEESAIEKMFLKNRKFTDNEKLYK